MATSPLSPGSQEAESWTNRELLQILSGRADQFANRESTLKIVLKEYHPRFSKLLSFYARPSAASQSALKSQPHLKGSMLEFMLRTSEMVDLDQVQLSSLVESFLVDSYKGTVKEFLQQLQHSPGAQLLMHKVCYYYRNERVFLLRCVNTILRNSLKEDEGGLFKEFVKAKLKAGLVQTAWQQFEQLVESKLPRLKHSTSPDVEREWVLWNLQEEVELLQILHLCCALFPLGPRDQLRAAAFLGSRRMGQNQAQTAILNGRQFAPLLTRVGHLVSTLLPLLGQWAWLEGRGLDSSKELVAMVMNNWGDSPPHTPTLLYVSVLHWLCGRHGDQEENGTVEQQRVLNSAQLLSRRALNAGVVSYLLELLKQEDKAIHHLLGQEVFHLVYAMLGLLGEFIGYDNLHEQKALCAVVCQLLSCDHIKEDILQQGFTEGVGMVISVNLTTFPVTACPVLDLMTALCSGPLEAEVVMATLKRLDYFAEVYGSQVGEEDEEGGVVSTEDRAVYGDAHLSLGQSIVLPANTAGTVVHIGAGPEAGGVVCWGVAYSAWTYLSLEAIHLYSDAHQMFSQPRPPPHGQNMVDNLTRAAGLVSALLAQPSPPMVEQLYTQVSMFYHFINRLSCAPSPPLELIAASLDCITSYVECKPQEGWNHLVQTGFLPHQMLTRGPADKSSWHAGHFGQLLASHEQPSGRYPVTLATLDCIHTVLTLESEVLDSTELLSCLVYLVEEVLPFYHQWRFALHSHRDRMSLKLLDVLSSCLALDRSPLAHFVRHSLLYSATGFGLLQNVAMGAVVMEIGAASWHSSRVVPMTEVLKSTFIVMESVLAHKTGPQLSPLEESFVRQPAGGQHSLFLYLSSLLYPHHDPTLTTTAIQLFAKLCQDVPMSVYASLGEEAPAIRDTLVTRLSTQCASNDLVLAILSLIVQCIKSQPGMTELFLAVSRDGEGFKMDAESCLVPIMDLMRSYKEGDVPPSVAMALYNVISSLWEDRKDSALVVLRSQPRFWFTLVHPLLCPLTVYYQSREACYQSQMKISVLTSALNILAAEAYYLAKTFDKDLLQCLGALKTSKQYQLWTRFCGPLPSDEIKAIPDDHPRKQALIDAHYSFIKSWVMFMVIIIKLHPRASGLEASEVVELVELVLETLEACVLRELSSAVLQASSLLSFLLTALLRHALDRQCPLQGSGLLERVGTVLQRGWGLEDFSPATPTLHTHLFTAALMLVRSRQDGRLSSPLQPRTLLGLVPFVSKALQKAFSSSHQDTQFQVLAVLLLTEVLTACPDDEVWRETFSLHSIFIQVVSLVQHLLMSTTHSSLLEVCLAFIQTSSAHPAAAKSLVINNISQVMCLSLSNMLNAMDLATSEPSLSIESGCHGNYCRVWQQSVGVVSGLLRTLKQNFVSSACDFVSIHCAIILKSLSITMTTLSEETLEVAYAVSGLVSTLMGYKDSWQFSHPQVFTAVLEQSLVLLNTVVSLLNNPSALSQWLLQPAKLGLADQKQNGESSPDSDFSSVDADLEWRLVQLLDSCVVTLQLNSPGVHNFLIEGVVDQARSVPMVTLTFSAPQAAILEAPSLGTLVCALDIGRALLKTKSSKGELAKTRVILTLLERVVLVLLSQTLCYLTHGHLDDGEKEVLKQELASEMETFLSSTARHFGHKGGQSPKLTTPSPHKGRSLDDSGSSKTTSSFSDSQEQGVFRLAAMFVAQYLR